MSTIVRRTLIGFAETFLPPATAARVRSALLPPVPRWLTREGWRMAPTAPAPGQPFRLNGFDYQLAPPQVSGMALGGPVIGFVQLPGTRKGEVPSKRGDCNVADLVWAERNEFFVLTQEEADRLAKGKPVVRLWAEAAVSAIREKFADAGPSWVLPGRCLPKMPSEIAPTTPLAALGLARRALHWEG